MEKVKRILILPDIRSVINVGAIFRTADAIGIDKIYLTGYTPAPVDRFGRKRNDFTKASLGAEDSVEWEQVDNVEELISDLKKDGVKIIALEQSDHSIDYKKVEVGEVVNVAIILGNEVNGVDDKVLTLADEIIEIPMLGEKESLNVSVAAGVVLFRLFDR